MDPNRCYLITISNGKELTRVALKAKREVEYYMEPDGQAELYEQLPMPIRSLGNIVQVEQLFKIVVKPELV